MVVFFVCKQKTAYERRISDGSSDVCSSDLLSDAAGKSLPYSVCLTSPPDDLAQPSHAVNVDVGTAADLPDQVDDVQVDLGLFADVHHIRRITVSKRQSGERRFGKEWFRMVKSRCSQNHYKKKNNQII